MKAEDERGFHDIQGIFVSEHSSLVLLVQV